jgi:hypothetical protein
MYVYPYLREAQNTAIRLGLPIPRSSQRKDKKLYVVYNGKEIHFGNKNYSDYLQHRDSERRLRFRKRASKILLKNGKYAYKDKNQPAYYAYHILW